jgi:para-aminobenzoate synthetase / 4-amino-4-deoxychorismate lyase
VQVNARLRFDFEGRTLAFGSPRRVYEAHTIFDVVPVLAAVDADARAGCWAAGYVAYEAAPAFDAAFAVRPAGGARLAWFGVFDEPSSAGTMPAEPPPPAAAPAFEPDVPRAEYDTAVATIRDAIGRGDVYQVNYTMSLRALAHPDAFSYGRLLRAQEPAYGALLELEDERILSVSPELFFRRRGRELVTRPMKGTARRGRWLEEDEAAAARLAASGKERAENLMIADLMRNDLGRLARFGGVHVPQLFAIERYPTVHQMTSTIAATLRAGVTLPDLFRALFPCGSVTGAPKVAATRWIAALERAPRGVYCGAIGVVEPGGDCTFSVAIRTLRVDRATGAAAYGTGGGITWDSVAGAEHDEALAKAAVLFTERPPFELLETLRLEHRRYARADRHLARLAASAQYFGFTFDRAAVAAVLDAAARRDGVWRARLLLRRDGRARAELAPLAGRGAGGPDGGGVIAPHAADGPAGTDDNARAGPAGGLRVALAAATVDSRDVFLFHKTTHRAVYDARRAAHPAADDVLLRNERGELTEFTTGNLVVELDGVLLTPPRTAGLLAGVYRGALLERGMVAERTLLPRDLARASRCWLTNSVRGAVPVELPVADGAAADGAAASAADRPVVAPAGSGDLSGRSIEQPGGRS